MSPEVQRPLADDQRGADEAPGEELSATTLPTAADIADAYVVLLLTPTDKVLRRCYLSLHGAQQALKRARKRGQPAGLVLARLEPVMTAELDDLDGVIE